MYTLNAWGLMPYNFDTSKISKTTINGIVSAAIAVVMALSTLPPGAKWTVIALAALRAVMGYLQQDATKPTDSQGKPVPSSEVAVKQ